MSTDKKSIEELIELALSSDEVVDMGELTEAAKFANALGIKRGEAKIPSALVYYMYRLWKGFEAKKQPKGPFFKEFSLIFEDVRDKKGRYYLLDPKPFDIKE